MFLRRSPIFMRPSAFSVFLKANRGKYGGNKKIGAGTSEAKKDFAELTPKALSGFKSQASRTSNGIRKEKKYRWFLRKHLKTVEGATYREKLKNVSKLYRTAYPKKYYVKKKTLGG